MKCASLCSGMAGRVARGSQQSWGPGTFLALLLLQVLTPTPPLRPQAPQPPPALGTGTHTRDQPLKTKMRRPPHVQGGHQQYRCIYEILFIFVVLGEVQCQNIWFMSHANYSWGGAG